MKIIKNKETALLLKSFLLNNQDYLSISILYYFDFHNPDVALDEQALFKESAKILDKTLLDYAMPKPNAEVLLCGNCHNPQPYEGVSRVGMRVGSLKKELFVFGEREWQMGRITQALPFETIPLDYAHATPIDERHLPHIEDPKSLTISKGEVKNPAGFMPLDMFRKENMKKLGTYDEAWKRELWPGFAEDMDYSFFNVAPEDQQLEGFFEGGESIALSNMHPQERYIETSLPQTSFRCFATKLHKEEENEFVEVKLQRDTLWLFPEIQRGVVIFRGTIAVEDEIYSNLRYLNIKPVESGEKVKSLEEYYELQKKELKKSVESDNSASEAADADIKEMRKEMFDMPREIKATVEETEGKRPFLKRTPAEKLERSHAMIDNALAQIEASQLRSQKMKEDFGHISKIDTSSLDATKQELLEAKGRLSDMTKKVEEVLLNGDAKKADAKAELEKIKNNPDIPDELKANIDFSFFEPEERLWSDYAFDFVCESVKRLEKAPDELHQLRHLGLAPRIITRSWIGFNNEAQSIKASEWNLESEENIELPKGFVTPRFYEATLKSLRVDGKIVLGSDEAYELFLSEGDATFPLFYLEDDREAYLCDQEAFDICNTLVCDDITGVGDDAKEAIEKASIIFYLQENGVVEGLPQAKKFDCGEYSNLFELHQNSVEIREQIVENLPQNIADGLPIQRDTSPKAAIARIKGSTDKVKADLKAKGEDVKKKLLQKRDETLAKANEALQKQGLDPIKIEPHKPLEGFIKASDVEANMNKAIDALKRRDGEGGVDLSEKIAELEKEKVKAVAMAQEAEVTFADGQKKIEEAKAKEKDPFPEWAKERMKKAGIDPNNPHDELTREKVIAYHAEGKSFQGKELGELDLSGLDLQGIDLRGANLTKTNFTKSHLREAKLTGAICSKTDFTETDLTEAEVSKVTFKEAVFKKTLLNGCVAKQAFFEKVTLKSINSSKINFRGAIFQEVKIEESSLSDSNFSSVNFLRSFLKGSSFYASKMYQLLFSKSLVSQCKFVAIDSKKMLFNKSKVIECDFSQSNLFNMRILKSSRFVKCDLSQSTMESGSIVEGFVEECNFQRAILNKTLIKKSEVTKSDFRGVVAKQGRFEYSLFEECNFVGINLFRGSLRRMDMKICDFSHSNLYAVEMYKTKLFEVNFSGANLKKSMLENRVNLIE